MTTVFIAEKPSLARAIAAALPDATRNHGGYIETQKGSLITWCFGHLLEQVDPQVYNPRYKSWDLRDLPIVPQRWQMQPRKSGEKQLKVIAGLLKKASVLVHAGDPDREGQLLVDEVIHYLGYPMKKRAGIRRLLIRDLNPAAVRRSLGSMGHNRDFVGLSCSALARSRADWLYGINMTRAYTLLGQKAGYSGVLSVGRVQTPVLGLVVRRDEEISQFVPRDFFEVAALIPHEGQQIKAMWQPSEACAPYRDAEGRVLSRELAENVASRIVGKPACVLTAEHRDSPQAPPLPFSLSTLQIAAAKAYGFSAAKVLQTCQNLYEKHKVITYPRSDCRYLPEEHFVEGRKVCQAIVSNTGLLKTAAAGANVGLRSKAWDDSKVGAHHAIIPTPKGGVSLLGDDKKLYEMIARQYLMQFYPPALYATAKLEFEIEKGRFVARGKTLIDKGWRALFTTSGKQRKESGHAYIPKLAVGTLLTCAEAVIVDKRTEPPKPFTDATLLQAMTGIARFVADSKLRNILKETDGIGTEATRAIILETLFRRTLLVRKAKNIHASQAGVALIHALPTEASYPDMTAHWEKTLKSMSTEPVLYAGFVAQLEATLREMLIGPQKGEVPASLRQLHR